MTRRSWVQTENGFVPKEEYDGHPTPSSPSVMGDIDPFVSPVTGRVVSSRSALRRHNKEHGVTDSRDYSREFMLRKTKERVAAAKGQTVADRRERVDLIRRQLDG